LIPFLSKAQLYFGGCKILHDFKFVTIFSVLWPVTMQFSCAVAQYQDATRAASLPQIQDLLIKWSLTIHFFSSWFNTSTLLVLKRHGDDKENFEPSSANFGHFV